MIKDVKTPPKTVYLDTNIVSYYFSNLPEYKIFRDATREWWEKNSKNYYLCSSLAAESELKSGEYLHQEEALQFIRRIAVFPIHDEIEKIAQYYIDHNPNAIFIRRKKYEQRTCYAGRIIQKRTQKVEARIFP